MESGILASDPLASTWGLDPLNAIWRAPVPNTLWGWNAEAVRKIRAPTLIIRGPYDDQGPFAPQREFRKVFVRVDCAGHRLMFEKQHMRLLEASKQRLRGASYHGHQRGSFFVNLCGQVKSVPLDVTNPSFKCDEEVEAERD